MDRVQSGQRQDIFIFISRFYKRLLREKFMAGHYVQSSTTVGTVHTTDLILTTGIVLHTVQVHLVSLPSADALLTQGCPVPRQNFEKVSYSASPLPSALLCLCFALQCVGLVCSALLSIAVMAVGRQHWRTYTAISTM